MPYEKSSAAISIQDIIFWGRGARGEIRTLARSFSKWHQSDDPSNHVAPRLQEDKALPGMRFVLHMPPHHELQRAPFFLLAWRVANRRLKRIVNHHHLEGIRRTSPRLTGLAKGSYSDTVLYASHDEAVEELALQMPRAVERSSLVDVFEVGSLLDVHPTARLEQRQGVSSLLMVLRLCAELQRGRPLRISFVV